jgi:hypothetical protein
MIYASLARALSDNSRFDTQRESPGILSHGDSGITGPESTRNILNMREAAESRSNMMCRNSDIGDRDASLLSKEVSVLAINGLLNFRVLTIENFITNLSLNPSLSDPRSLIQSPVKFENLVKVLPFITSLQLSVHTLNEPDVSTYTNISTYIDTHRKPSIPMTTGEDLYLTLIYLTSRCRCFLPLRVSRRRR